MNAWLEKTKIKPISQELKYALSFMAMIRNITNENDLFFFMAKVQNKLQKTCLPVLFQAVALNLKMSLLRATH